MVYGSGTVSGSNLTDSFISTNQYGYDIDEISASGLNLYVTAREHVLVQRFQRGRPKR